MLIKFLFILGIFGEIYPKINARSPVKIVGGSEATIKDFPAVVSIQLNNYHICGGVFITMQHILTAAHCVCDTDRRTGNLYFFDLTVVSGSNNCRKGDVSKVIKTVIHPLYQGIKDHHYNDIAIIKLEKALTADESHWPIYLPRYSNYVGLTGTVIGWGYRYDKAGVTEEVLQKAPASVLSNENCQMRVPWPIRDTQVCGFYSNGIGFCEGDSGGPLILNGEIVGIVSLGYECGTGIPDIYTRVSSYTDWIYQQLD